MQKAAGTNCTWLADKWQAISNQQSRKQHAARWEPKAASGQQQNIFDPAAD